MIDLIIRGGTVVDGTGTTPFVADVAVDEGTVVAVGTTDEAARRVIDADGLVVTPGFVDPHTHYDGQATWDPLLTPSCWHGVTTAILGNCGVGFAPVAPGREDWLISVMESVEDIPGSALAEGITWGWESFPEYLDALERLPHAIDLATQVPHAAVRAYVMGERCADDHRATEGDVAAMAAIVAGAMDAGALGFTTSRTAGHMMADGQPIPGTNAAAAEVIALAAAARGGVVQLVPAGESGGMPSADPEVPRLERELIMEIARTSGARVTFLVLQGMLNPDAWRDDFAMARRAADDGLRVHPQVADRCFGVLMGLQSRLNPFRTRPGYEPIASLPLAERVRAMRDPNVRASILADRGERPTTPTLDHLGRRSFSNLFPLGAVPDYEPSPDRSIAAIAAREGRDPWEVVYDTMLDDDGRELLLFPLLNYAGGSYAAQYEMMSDHLSVQGLGDGGAHCGIVSDASMTTYLLSHWVRDRSRGPRLSIQHAVRRLTHDPARLYGLSDRGVLAAGLRADVNVIDLERLGLHRPEQVDDLPAGAGRLVQRSDGYVASIVAGRTVLEEGEPTGELPGALVRGSR